MPFDLSGTQELAVAQDLTQKASTRPSEVLQWHFQPATFGPSLKVHPKPFSYFYCQGIPVIGIYQGCLWHTSLVTKEWPVHLTLSP